ncbi:MAG: hypothetical protein ACJ76H_16435 [Bacteriovoracaceae bacterium]
MKLVFAFIFLLTSTLALAAEVNTDCPWANQDGRTSGKVVKENSSTSKSKNASAIRQ